MKVKGLQIIKEKGSKPTAVDRVEAYQGTGILGDYHNSSAFDELEISFFPVELIKDKSNEEGFCFSKFVPNIYTEGLLITNLEEGDVLQVGKTIIEIVEIEGDCHFNCPVREKSGSSCNANSSIMYGKVVKSGEINNGDSIEIVEW